MGIFLLLCSVAIPMYMYEVGVIKINGCERDACACWWCNTTTTTTRATDATVYVKKQFEKRFEKIFSILLVRSCLRYEK